MSPERVLCFDTDDSDSHKVPEETKKINQHNNKKKNPAAELSLSSTLRQTGELSAGDARISVPVDDITSRYGRLHKEPVI